MRLAVCGLTWDLTFIILWQHQKIVDKNKMPLIFFWGGKKVKTDLTRKMLSRPKARRHVFFSYLFVCLSFFSFFNCEKSFFLREMFNDLKQDTLHARPIFFSGEMHMYQNR